MKKLYSLYQLNLILLLLVDDFFGHSINTKSYQDQKHGNQSKQNQKTIKTKMG